MAPRAHVPWKITKAAGKAANQRIFRPMESMKVLL